MGKYKLFNDFRHREVATFATLEEAIKAHKMKGSASDAFSVYEGSVKSPSDSFPCKKSSDAKTSPHGFSNFSNEPYARFHFAFER